MQPIEIESHRICSNFVTSKLPLIMVILAVPVCAGSSVPGINNFYKVDENVYRGAQPSQAGFQYLARIGVKTVIDLREADSRSRAEEKLVTAAGLRYINVPMSGLTPPTQAQISKILATLENPAAEPVFVHRMRGADRTGAVIASYRIEKDGWNNARALEEAKSLGMSFFQLPRERFILNFHAPVPGENGVESAQGPDAAGAVGQ